MARWIDWYRKVINLFSCFIEFVTCHPLVFELKIVIHDGRILESNYVETN